MPQWDFPYGPPYSIYQCERRFDQAKGLIPCRLRQPLKSPDHIRLLKIYPPGWPNRLTEQIAREDDSRVQCDIFQVSLAGMTTKDRPYFATLLYAWGDPSVTQKIRCAKELVWQYFASVEKCMDTIGSSIPAQSLCRQLLDVLSMGRDWLHCPAWADLARRLPAQTRSRMISSSLGAAWMINHIPGLASKAKLTLNRWLHPREWRDTVNDVDLWLYSANDGTRLFTTDNFDAIIGTGPEGLRVGDIVGVLYGGDVPFILHPDGQGQYTLIGECYVSGIMQGEALDMGLEEREFLLV